jgi:S1-C subfamily serine protease
MSGPKHLWSGDWQRESEAASAEHAKRQRQPADLEPAENAAPRPSQRRKRSGLGRAVAITAVTVLVVAGAAYGLSALLGSSGKETSTSASVASTPRPTPTSPPVGSPPPAAAPQPTTARPVHWLGMEIQTLPPGAAIVETVALGSGGDRAGLEPGDVILEINNRPVTSATAIATAIQGLHAGERIPVQVSQGSNLEQTVVTLAAPPTQHP